MSSSNGNGNNGNGHSNGSGSGASEVPYRGDIIVDTSVLFGLCIDIPKNNGKVLKTGKYIDTLYFLAENGYHIIIPEMISFETEQVLASGADISDFLGGPLSPERYKILKPFLTNGLPKSSTDKNYKDKVRYNINVRSNTGPDEIDDFCKNMQGISDSCPRSEDGYIPKNEDFNKSYDKITVLLEKKQEARKRDKFDYGDQSILSLLNKDYKNSNNKPVFVLADDVGLKEHINNEFPRVNVVTTSSLIFGIVGAGLSKAVGFPPSPPQDLESDRRKIFKEIYKNTKGKIYIDDVEGYISDNYKKAFARSLTELSEHLKEQELIARYTDPEDNRVMAPGFIAKEENRNPKIGDAIIHR